jgi:hypothetical protein
VPQVSVGTKSERARVEPTPAPDQPAQYPHNNLRLSLRQQFGRAYFHECRLDIVTHEGSGSAFVRCEVAVMPTKEVSRRYQLTPEQANRLTGLVRTSELLSGHYIGIEGVDSDGPPFETLKITLGGETGVLVTSGNNSFATGARRSLLDLLQAMLREAQ